MILGKTIQNQKTRGVWGCKAYKKRGDEPEEETAKTRAFRMGKMVNRVPEKCG